MRTCFMLIYTTQTYTTLPSWRHTQIHYNLHKCLREYKTPAFGCTVWNGHATRVTELGKPTDMKLVWYHSISMILEA